MATTNYGFRQPVVTEPVYPTGVDNMSGVIQDIDTKIKELDDANTKKALLTAIGDMVYASSIGTPARLGKGTTGQVLIQGAEIPAWGDLPVAMVLSGASLPVATVDYRGKVFTVFGIAGVADTCHVCLKDALDAYVWKTVSFVA